MSGPERALAAWMNDPAAYWEERCAKAEDELARRDERIDLLLEDFEYAYDKMVHGAPAAMHDLAARLLGGGAS